MINKLNINRFLKLLLPGSGNGIEFNSNQNLFILQAGITGCFNTLVNGVFMTGYLLWMGASDSTTGMVSSLPMLASILQIFTIKMWEKCKQKKELLF